MLSQPLQRSTVIDKGIGITLLFSFLFSVRFSVASVLASLVSSCCDASLTFYALKTRFGAFSEAPAVHYHPPRSKINLKGTNNRKNYSQYGSCFRLSLFVEAPHIG